MAPTGSPAMPPRGRPPRSRRTVMAVASRPWMLITIAALVLFALWVASTRSQSHEVRAAFPSAVNLVPGLDVQANGVDVGKITSVDYSDGRAIVGIGIDDEALWPLRRGTTATIRYGTTAGNGTRKIDLVPGPRNAPEIPEHGIIGAEFTKAPVDFDDVFRMMDRETRAHMRSMAGRTAQTLDGRAHKLNDGIKETAPALEAAGGLLGDLASDEQALNGVIVDTHHATRALASRRDAISGLVTVAASTFQEFAQNTRAVGESIQEAPAALDDTRTTLARLDQSVGGLKAMVKDVAPGAAALPGLAADARPAVAELAATAPKLTQLLRTGRRAAPAVTRMLTEGTPFARRLTPILSDLAPMFGCLRPYAPEIAGALSNWASFGMNYDGYGHYMRMNVMGGPTSLTSTPPVKSDALTKTTGLGYAMPRPPGLNGGKPWLMPECGVGADALDPTKDPEDK
jgi:virulence factor Mce-like protein